jgi:hypothetical protein
MRIYWAAKLETAVSLLGSCLKQKAAALRIRGNKQ